VNGSPFDVVIILAMNTTLHIEQVDETVMQTLRELARQQHVSVEDVARKELGRIASPYVTHSTNGSHSQDKNDIVQFFGEPFRVVMDDGTFIVKHLKWSLVGTGNTLEQAVLALLTEAKEVAPFYVTEADDTLSPEAVKLRYFLQNHFI
jgi:hypothetical protein